MHWSDINKLPLNAAKCVVMHITRSRQSAQVTYRMGGASLDVVTTHKHLGVILSNNLDWGPHIDEVSRKANRLLGFIQRTVGCNDHGTMKKLYFALVRPILEYCAPVWTPYKETHKNKLEGVQRRFTRFCFPGPWRNRPSYTVRLQTLDIPTVNNRFLYLRVMFIIGCLWSKYNIHWSDLIQVNTHNSRLAANLNFLHHYHSRTDAFHNSLFVSFPRLWSLIPVNISNIAVFSKQSFSFSLRRHLYPNV